MTQQTLTDRELLEAAARAAGIAIRWAADLKGYIYDVDWGYSPREMWRPLTDDGDALRLAVRLQLTVCNEHLSAGVAYCTRGDDEVFPEVQSGTTADAEVLPEDYAATRRAIVRAAAAMATDPPTSKTP